MKIRYLGTAAAEAVPAFFCKCQICENARKVKGKEIRTRSQALINDDLLIDFCPDTYDHLIRYDFFKLEDIKNILITHAHPDHLDIQDLEYIREGYAAVVDGPVNVYVSDKGYNSIKNVFDRFNSKRLVLNHINPFETYQIGNYKITPLKANHDPSSSPVLYLIDDGKKLALYAHDTGVFLEETMEYLKNMNRTLDFISLDCTSGFLLNYSYEHHLSYEGFLKVINDLKEFNIINEKSIVVANHFSHNGKASYEELQKFAKKDNVLVSYDGMEINI